MRIVKIQRIMGKKSIFLNRKLKFPKKLKIKKLRKNIKIYVPSKILKKDNTPLSKYKNAKMIKTLKSI